MKILCVLCELGPTFQILFRWASFFRGLNVLEMLRHLITIVFVEVDRVMCHGGTESLLGNNCINISKMNLGFFLR
jgi:hypothetical protein